MKKWAGILAVAGALWMTLVLRFGSLRLARLSNYPGAFGARWVQYRGIGPSPALVLAFNIWLVLTSSIEWVVIGLALRAVLRRLLKTPKSTLTGTMSEMGILQQPRPPDFGQMAIRCDNGWMYEYSIALRPSGVDNCVSIRCQREIGKSASSCNPQALVRRNHEST